MKIDFHVGNLVFILKNVYYFTFFLAIFSFSQCAYIDVKIKFFIRSLNKKEFLN